MPGPTTEQDDDVIVDDRRSAIASALESIEAEKPEALTLEPPLAETAPDTAATAPSSPETPPVATTPSTEIAKPPTAPGAEEFSIDRAPQSWRPASKVKWNTVDPELRQEIVKREREITRALGETAEARQFHGRFNEVMTPYKERIAAVKADPLAIFGELLQSDHILTTADPTSKAEYLADLIQYYKVDIQALDKALAGSAAAAPAQDTTHIQQIIAQELAPVKTWLQSQTEADQRKAAEAQQRQAEENRATIAAMASDSVKYPHFDHLRDEMADIVEYSAKKGIYLTLDQAYTRAIAMNPELGTPVTAPTSRTDNSAQLANARAQKALKASKSVGGAPRGTATSVPDATDRKATINAAFDEIDGR